MKRVIVLVLICMLALFGCSATSQNHSESVESTFIVREVSETHLLVAEIGEDGKAIEAGLYSAPNPFHPNHEIAVGEKIVISHNGIALESYPMQFDKVYSMTYYDKENDCNVTVNID